MPRRTWTGAEALRSHLLPLADLSCDPANLRLHGPRSIEAIAASLRRFGQQRPICVDAAGVSVAGAGVLEAARSIGWTHVAATRSPLAGADRVGYAIADNRTAELSEWDTEALGRVAGVLPGEILADAGFTREDLAELGALDPEALDDSNAPAPAAEAVSRRGDLWHLGDHRLLCGDSTDAGDVARVMDGEKAALVATDPPYLVDYTGERPAKKGDCGTGKDWSELYREIDVKDAGAFFRGLFARVLEVLAPHAPIYCWHAHRRCGLIQTVWEELGILDHQQIMWVKPASVLGRCFWHFQHEPCMMGWRQGSKPEHNGVHIAGSVWAVPWVRPAPEDLAAGESADVWFEDWEGKARIVGNEHPTQKPLELFARPMRKHTREGDVVFEPFSGSGSQLIAAERLRRRCRAVELQPVFVDVAIRRWQTQTGASARLGAGGPTWDQVRLERSTCSDSSPPASQQPPPRSPSAPRSTGRSSASPRSTRARPSPASPPSAPNSPASRSSTSRRPSRSPRSSTTTGSKSRPARTS